MSSALVGILGIVVGVLLSNVAARILEYLRRRERIKDVSTAIRAEIRSHRQRLLLFGGDPIGHIVEKIRRNEGYTLFVPSEGKSFVLDAIVGEIHILPTGVIDPVVYYYRQIEALGQFAQDLRSDRFASLEAPRKAEMYTDYIAMGAHALKLANEAIEVLEQTSVARLRARGPGNRPWRR
jgi:hypothetical protein